uniref:SWIM-type domain-containing protein n=1 Tax=Lactuca sativa TaxID=4236 RepID=A0A9R1VRM0_LACSA|nr:hypothetical protein LSAT_V11C400182340 [Lactuca sativa]
MSRAHLDSLLNNLCEVFNSKLDHGRDKPIITVLDEETLHYTKRIDKCKSILTLSATTILETIKTIARKYRALFCGSGKYQVTDMMFDQYVVNLKEGACSCRYWEITGIVYRHEVCVIWEHIQNGEKPNNLNIGCIPVISQKHEHVAKSLMSNHSYTPYTSHTSKLLIFKLVGRPKKRRRRAIDEPTNQLTNLSRKFLTVTCSKCMGHNSRTCKGKGGSSQSAVGGSSQGVMVRSNKDAVGGTSQGSVSGSSEVVMGVLRAKKRDKGKKP